MTETTFVLGSVRFKLSRDINGCRKLRVQGADLIFLWNNFERWDLKIVSFPSLQRGNNWLCLSKSCLRTIWSFIMLDLKDHMPTVANSWLPHKMENFWGKGNKYHHRQNATNSLLSTFFYCLWLSLIDAQIQIQCLKCSKENAFDCGFNKKWDACWFVSLILGHTEQISDTKGWTLLATSHLPATSTQLFENKVCTFPQRCTFGLFRP